MLWGSDPMKYLVFFSNRFHDFLYYSYFIYGIHSRYWVRVLLHLQLHFSKPEVHNEIYNFKNRWDKVASLYHSFGEDQSSFGFLTYAEAKERKDVLAPLFSPKSILNMHGLVQDKVLASNCFLFVLRRSDCDCQLTDRSSLWETQTVQ